jgi:hypothetical protein
VQSALIVLVLGILIAVPGIGAALAAFPPGRIALVTRAAAAFGMGYGVAGGCAFVLSAAGFLHRTSFLGLWLVVSAGLWLLALRRERLREQARALVAQAREHAVPIALGALVVLAIVLVHVTFVDLLGGSRYVYYLNGLDIANSAGVPHATLEYGQAWAPATDKIFLDSFTAAIAMLAQNAAAGPGALLLVSTAGSALGLWATAWELGLRRLGSLLALLMLNNLSFLQPWVTRNFFEYRADDFGIAIAFTALAVGIHALRDRRWAPSVMAGVMLGAATGSHLIPAGIAIIGFVLVLGTEMIAAGRGAKAEAAGTAPDPPERPRSPRRLVLERGGIVLGSLAASSVVIRLCGGGDLGLGGATNPGGYQSITVKSKFDPTALLYAGAHLRAHRHIAHWFMPPSRVVANMMRTNAVSWPVWALLALFAVVLTVAVVLFFIQKAPLRQAGVVGAGLVAAVFLVALAFDFRYQIWIDATFGIRRLAVFISLGIYLVGLAALEAVLAWLATARRVVSTAVSIALVCSLGGWLVPDGIASPQARQTSSARVQLVNWLRTETPCDARFVVNQRTEGVLTATTGRFALLEGMGAFLRVDRITRVLHLSLLVRRYFRHPQERTGWLRRQHITYVIYARRDFSLGYVGLIGPVQVTKLNADRNLHQVFSNAQFTVYQVGSPEPAPISPLLEGPYLHCQRAPLHF